MKALGSKNILLIEDEILLRKFKLTDAESMFKNYCNDEEVSKYLTWLLHGSIEVTKDILKEWVNSYDLDTYKWAIEFQGEVIGGIDLLDVDLKEESAKVGYVLRRESSSAGIMTKVLKEVVRFAFENLEIKKLLGIHAIENLASGKVMEKSGFKFLKVVKGQNKDNRGNLIDVKLYIKENTYKSNLGNFEM